nr:hypothetical protein [Streptomyces polyasparticus]
MTERTAEAKLADLVAAHDVRHLQQWLDERPDHEIADEIARSDPATAGVLFRLLDKDRASEVFGELDGPSSRRSSAPYGTSPSASSSRAWTRTIAPGSWARRPPTSRSGCSRGSARMNGS